MIFLGDRYEQMCGVMVSQPVNVTCHYQTDNVTCPYKYLSVLETAVICSNVISHTVDCSWQLQWWLMFIGAQ
jgi:hypothetical protein